jgi:asparagine synthetase B (glutamine-hydrolysing)
MIKNYTKILVAIALHKFATEASNQKLEEKIEVLEKAINDSIYETGKAVLERQSHIHLALSGGMDSSTILLTMLDYGFPVVTHTIAGSEDHPDICYSKMLTKKLGVEHRHYIISPTTKNLSVSTYLLLFDAVKKFTRTLVCGDCIDEQLGGYYPHQNPTQLPIYDVNKPLEENRLKALQYFMDRLVENHLIIQEECSDECNITIYLPYGHRNVFNASSKFLVNELLDDNNRKIPMRIISELKGLPTKLIERRKLGLVQAMDNIKYNF